jgi:hypothetical protein
MCRYQVLTTSPLTAPALPVLRELRHKFDLRGTPMVGHPLSIICAPENLPLLHSTLAALQLTAETVIPDYAE